MKLSERYFQFSFKYDANADTPFYSFVYLEPIIHPIRPSLDCPIDPKYERQIRYSMAADGFKQTIVPPPQMDKMVISCLVEVNEVTDYVAYRKDIYYRLWLMPECGTIAKTAKQIGYWHITQGLYDCDYPKMMFDIFEKLLNGEMRQ